MPKYPRISNPLPGPEVIPPQPMPEPFNPPRLAQAYDLKQFRPAVARINHVELDETVKWLIPLLKDRWPELNEGSIYYMLKSVINDKHSYLVKSENVCGLFDIIMDAMDPAPRMRERWVRSKKEAKPAEEEMFYSHVRDHAQQIGCTELLINIDSNCAMGQTSNSRGVATVLQDDRKNSNVKQRKVFAVYLKET